MRGQSGYFATYSKHSAAFFFVIAVVALLASCGLPTADYLYPTSGFIQQGANLITLYHNANNINSVNGFLGYNIYYRAFDNAGDAADSLVNLSKSLTSSNINSIASLYGYYPILKKSSDGANFDYSTLIPYTVCESGLYSYFALNMNGPSAWTISGESGTTLLNQVVRNKGNGASVADSEFFQSSLYSYGDQDYNGVSNPTQLYFVFFAVAVGDSTSSIGVAIFSNPNESNDIIESGVYNPGM